MFEPMALRPSIEKVNASLLQARSWLRKCQESILACGEENLNSSSSDCRKAKSGSPSAYDKGTRRNTFYLDALIASCRYSFSSEWFPADGDVQKRIRELLTSYPPWRRGSLFRCSEEESDDSGVNSQRGRNDNSSHSSSTTSIDTCVREYLQQKSLLEVPQNKPSECSNSTNSLCPSQCLSRLSSRTSNGSIVMETLDVVSGSSRHGSINSMESVFKSRSRSASPKVHRPTFGYTTDTNVTAGNTAEASCSTTPENESTDSLDTDAKLSFDKDSSVKLSLQYFRNGNMLRVILVQTNNLGLKTGEVFFKVALFRDECEEEKQAVKSVPASQTNINKEVLFEDKDLESASTWVLRVRVYSKRSWFAKAKCVGETHLSLDRFDLFMNTTCWCLLRPKSPDSSALMCRGDDVQLMSRDRSINAYAAVTLSATNQLRGPTGVDVVTPAPQAAVKCQTPNLRRSNTGPKRPKRIYRLFSDRE